VKNANIPENINDAFENVGVKQIDFCAVTTISYKRNYENVAKI